MPYNAEHLENEVHIEPRAPVQAELPTTVHRLADELGVSKRAVYAAISTGELPSFRVGSLVRVFRSQVPPALVAWWKRDRCVNQTRPWPDGPLVYFLGGADGYVKIGFTTDLSRRVIELQPGSPVAFTLLAYAPGANIGDERRYHRRFHKQRAEGEWFRLHDGIVREIERLNAANEGRQFVRAVAA